MPVDNTPQCDVVIVGAGVAGALIAKRLGQSGFKVVILESGPSVPPNINSYLNTYFRISAKVPESPYPPDLFTPPAVMNAGRPTSLMIGAPAEQSYLIQDGPLHFGSTYERAGGGTALHWLGTSLRLLPNDFRMSSYDKNLFVDWPIDYDTLESWYGDAEHELGVSADTQQQSFLGIRFRPGYTYPMPAIPLSQTDQAVADALNLLKPGDLGFLGLSPDNSSLKVTATPAARNSQPYQSRRVCAGNTNCIPICPIQAKYDPTVTLSDALDTRNVEIRYQTVAKEVVVAPNAGPGGTRDVARIDYLQYQNETGGPTIAGSISAKVYVIAAHAIETPRLLLMSKNGGVTANGVANRSDQVGRNLMDHPYYVAWAQTQSPVFPYRGPLSTAGVEDAVRDGPFRHNRAAFRLEIGNEGWNFVVGGGDKGSDPGLTTLDLINGVNYSGVNTGKQALFGDDLTRQLNSALTRQLRLGFLIEQTPDSTNRVTLSSKFKDGLGMSRPEIHYNLSDYTKRGVVAAKLTASAIFKAMHAQEFTLPGNSQDPMAFDWPIDGKTTSIRFGGAGHIMGTYRMGKDPHTSVVDSDQCAWDHRNLYLVGSGTFPTTATANPTLTLAALCLRTAATIEKNLGGRRA